ncbi:hypothetical protein CQW23_29867 [Capsicum baccatum]|uniref:Uncharacterized protein n=1 Tax=Capsicum baccatum TaxID=33114 RepID=A0A2G2VC44_CAPBA|nr:hypothetical protein CQW23_29867 [Capsicum baccatum]
MLEYVKISLRGDTSMPYIFGEFAANLPAQVKSLIVITWNTQVTHFPTEMQIFRNPRLLVLLFESTYNFDRVRVSPVLDACPVLQSMQIMGSGMMDEDNSNELASPVTSVKNDSMAEDNTDELVSPVTSVKNYSMDEDNIDELVSPVTSVTNDSAGSKPDKMSTIKLRSMSNGKRRHSSEAKPWHPLSKRKIKLPVDEQSPARTLMREAKKGTLVKQNLSTPSRSVLGE